MNRLLTIAAVGEAGTGLAPRVCPRIVLRLFGPQMANTELIVSRFAGISLIALAVTCWPKCTTDSGFFGMLIYSTMAMLYLMLVGIEGSSGVSQWPAVAVHAALSALLVGFRFNKSRSESQA